MNFFQTLGQVEDPEVAEPSFMRAPAPQQPVMGGTQPGSMGGPSMADIERNAGVPAPTKRGSMLDIIGGLADYIAESGGAKPGYQSTIDARTQREREAELYPLKKQELQYGNQNMQSEISARRAKMVSPLATKAMDILDKGGEEQLFRILPLMYQTLGLTPEEVKQYDSQIRANPRETLTMLAWLGKGEDAPKRGLTPLIDANGNAWQLREDGGAEMLDLNGVKANRGTSLVDRGNYVDVVDDLTGRVIRSEPKGGNPSADQRPTEGGGLEPIPNSTLERTQQTAADDKMAGYQATLTALDAVDPYMADLQASLDALKATGSMTGVDSQGWLGNLRALGYQNIPGIERTFNAEGGSARKTVDSITTVMATNFMNAVKKATDEGASSASRLLDTEKEVQRLKDSVTNAEDYNSAVAALNRFKAYVADTKSYISLQAAKAAEKRARVGGGQQAPKPKSGGGDWKYLGPVE